MEILIPGLILVALMVYASTRIKRNAAAAFEAETIESDEFVIQKPAEFLHNLNGDPRYVFEAYSRDFSESIQRLRVGTARITAIGDGVSLEAAASGITSKGSVVEDTAEILDERHYRVITADETDGDVLTRTKHKLGERDGSVFQLEVRSARRRARSWLGRNLYRHLSRKIRVNL